MKTLIDFINEKDVNKSLVCRELKCSCDEALILQHMCRKYVNSQTEFSTCEILIEIFGLDDYIYLNKIKCVQNLLKNRWINYGGLGSFIIEEPLGLEILNLPISLSSSFLSYLEKGNVLHLEEKSEPPYNDHLEYLQEQFTRIGYYQKISQNLDDFQTQKAKQNLQILECKIAKRLESSTIKIKVEEIFSSYSLNEKEQIIFLALLKEEYVGDMDSTREQSSLISLISRDNYEKIKNRILLEDDSTLIKSGLLDYDEMMSTFGSIGRTFFISEDILQTILNPSKNKKSVKLKLDTLVSEQDIFELLTPKTTLDDVVMSSKTRELMDTLLRQVDKNVVARLKKWGIKKNRRGIDAKILLYGPPGTGKTMTATSLAKSLKKQVLSFDCSKILSKYVGESEQNVRRIFDTYKDICKKSKSEPILLLNEADQFLSSRSETASGGADKMHNQMQNIFLEQIEKFEGILVATTNFLESLDRAFSRRFDYKIAFEKPNFAQRLDLWRRVLPNEAVYEENFDIEKLANYPLSGGQIVVVLKNTALKVAIKDEPIFTQEDFIKTIQRELSGAFGDEKLVGFVN